VLRGMGWLSERYRVSFNRDIFERDGFLAGSDERRREELTWALRNPTLNAVVTARGGHGLLRILQAVPWGTLKTNPKWLVGFSDPTAMHAECWTVGVASLHAANVAGLGRGDDATRKEWIAALEHPDQSRVLAGKSLVKGRVRGPLVGGNLTVLTMLAAAGRLWLPEGCILVLEDICETSYRIDRMFAALRVGGYFDRVSGFALGEFTDCSGGIFRVPVARVIEDCLGGSKPVVCELPFGHGRNNSPLIFGKLAQLDGVAATLTVAAQD
jgi:muramoyltetrapeptide carboxypeptidase